jgi:hypothetical protein
VQVAFEPPSMFFVWPSYGVKGSIWSICLTLLAHCDLLSYVDDFRVRSSIAKEPFEKEVGENTRSSKCKHFSLINRSMMR